MKYSTLILAATLLISSGAFSLATAQCERPSQEEREAVKTALFAEADADDNNQLSAEEFAALRELVEAERAERLFTCIDSNGDGAVSAEEFAAHQPPQEGRGKRGGPGGQRPF